MTGRTPLPAHWLWTSSFPGVGSSNISGRDVLVASEFSRSTESTCPGSLPLASRFPPRRSFLLCDDEARTRYYDNWPTHLFSLCSDELR